MKISIYDLLGMIKDDKAPRKIVFKEEVYTFDYEAYDYIATNGDGLFDYYATPRIIDDEVVILETTITMTDDKFTGWEAETKCDDEKNLLASNKIEKLEIDALGMLKDKNNSHIISIIDIVDKINEIIEVINEK